MGSSFFLFSDFWHPLPWARAPCLGNRPARLVKLVAVFGPLDIDDPQPAITVMMPDED